MVFKFVLGYKVALIICSFLLMNFILFVRTIMIGIRQRDTNAELDQLVDKVDKIDTSSAELRLVMLDFDDNSQEFRSGIKANSRSLRNAKRSINAQLIDLRKKIVVIKEEGNEFSEELYGVIEDGVKKADSLNEKVVEVIEEAK